MTRVDHLDFPMFSFILQERAKQSDSYPFVALGYTRITPLEMPLARYIYRVALTVAVFVRYYLAQTSGIVDRLIEGFRFAPFQLPLVRAHYQRAFSSGLRLVEVRFEVVRCVGFLNQVAFVIIAVRVGGDQFLEESWYAH